MRKAKPIIKVCPNPGRWHEIHQQLHAIAAAKSLPPPPIPLILNGWVFSNDLQKMERWNATVVWAQQHGCEEILKQLRTEDW
jgi:hypothetical protein